MRGPGILWMLQTAVGFSMAGPIFVVGLEFVRNGRFIAGVGFLALGIAVVQFPTFLINRIGGPRTWIRRRLRTNTDEEPASTGSESESDEEQGLRAATLGRLRNR